MWSAGVIIFTMLQGHKPFEADSYFLFDIKQFKRLNRENKKC